MVLVPLLWDWRSGACELAGPLLFVPTSESAFSPSMPHKFTDRGRFAAAYSASGRPARKSKVWPGNTFEKNLPRILGSGTVVKNRPFPYFSGPTRPIGGRLAPWSGRSIGWLTSSCEDDRPVSLGMLGLHVKMTDRFTKEADIFTLRKTDLSAQRPGHLTSR